VRSLVVVLALTASASAEPVRAPTCDAASARIAQVVTAGDRVVVKLAVQRCDKDRWSADARACFAAAATDRAAAACLDRLTKDQTRLFAGDADRLDVKPTGRRLVQWLSRKPTTAFVTPSRPTLFALAAETEMIDVSKARTLHAEGMSAYRAGRYQLAVQKFQAANDADPSPELVYHLAQAYRLKGDYRMALELYERYVELAPDGAAAADSRRQIESLLDQLP